MLKQSLDVVSLFMVPMKLLFQFVSNFKSCFLAKHDCCSNLSIRFPILVPVCFMIPNALNCHHQWLLSDLIHVSLSHSITVNSMSCLISLQDQFGDCRKKDFSTHTGNATPVPIIKNRRQSSTGLYAVSVLAPFTCIG